MTTAAPSGSGPTAQAVRGTAPPYSTANGDSLLRAEQLTRTFNSAAGTLNAIEGVSLDIRSGEFLAIVGPSGCGKTTFLRILAGLDRPTTGQLITGASPPTNSLVFQGRSVFPWMTVEDNIAYGLQLAGVSRRERTAKGNELLKMIGIERFRFSYPHQLSEGMRQRVAIARALAVDPDLLLMDEPFSALDEQTKLVLQDDVLDIWERTRKTVVFITHSIDEALVMADRVVVFTAQPGRIKAIINVDFPRPRSFLEVRSDPGFGARFQEIWNLLQDEARVGPKTRSGTE